MNKKETIALRDEHRKQAPLTIAGKRLSYALSMAYTDILSLSQETFDLDVPPYIYVIWSDNIADRPVYIGVTNMPNAARLQNADHPVNFMVRAAMLGPNTLRVYWYESHCGGAIWSLERDLQRSLDVLYRNGSEARVRLNRNQPEQGPPTLREVYLAVYRAFSVSPNLNDPMWKDSDMDRLISGSELKEMALSIAGAVGVPRQMVLGVWNKVS